MNLPKTPRRLAIFAEELQRKYTELLETVRNSADLLLNKNKQIEELTTMLDNTAQQRDMLLAEAEREHNDYVTACADINRFVWWFENGDNDDEQLREVKMKRARGEKVSIGEWRAALDGAMERKEQRR